MHQTVEQKRRYLAAVAADTYMDETGRLKPTKPEPPKQGRSADDGNPNDGSSSGSTKLLAAAAGAARSQRSSSTGILARTLYRAPPAKKEVERVLSRGQLHGTVMQIAAVRRLPRARLAIVVQGLSRAVVLRR